MKHAITIAGSQSCQQTPLKTLHHWQNSNYVQDLQLLGFIIVPINPLEIPVAQVTKPSQIERQMHFL